MKHNQPTVTEYWNNTATEFDSIYSGQGKNSLSRFLDRYFRHDIYQRFNWVMERSGNPTGKHVCDVGCGSGRFVAEYARRGAAKIVGIDPAPNMLELAGRLARQAGVESNCEFVEADILDYKPTESFDITIAIGLWDYIPDPLQRLETIRSMTKEKFLSAWPRFWTWRMPVRKLRLQYVLGCPVYFFRRSQVYSLLERAGFRIASCDTIGKLYCVEATPR